MFPVCLLAATGSVIRLRRLVNRTMLEVRVSAIAHSGHSALDWGGKELPVSAPWEKHVVIRSRRECVDK
eukprot:3948875-Heterocapsa_arctica.AAC.1